jgi:hypothetical protein
LHRIGPAYCLAVSALDPRPIVHVAIMNILDECTAIIASSRAQCWDRRPGSGIGCKRANDLEAPLSHLLRSQRRRQRPYSEIHISSIITGKMSDAGKGVLLAITVAALAAYVLKTLLHAVKRAACSTRPRPLHAKFVVASFVTSRIGMPRTNRGGKCWRCHYSSDRECGCLRLDAANPRAK